MLLGTGTPSPDPARSGPATAIVVDGTPYLVDFGPGVVRRAAAAAEKGVKGLSVVNLRVVFLTHLHSDHTAGYPDLILTPWAVGRRHPLEVYGPKGLQAMTEHILEAYREDIRIRLRDKAALGALDQLDGYKVNAHEIGPGVVYKDEKVTVKAFLVEHGDVPQAFGFRFETPDRTIVISGDAAPSQSVVDNCNGCDVLIHEAYSLMTYRNVSPPYQSYRRRHHTSSTELAEIAKRARPGLLILYHRANPGGVGRPNPEEALLQEIRRTYDGAVVTGHDLDVF
ncbi:MBL fold metallo-hydrolase [Phenylobacterium terrae]|uniref:MBL fold metallo-hydrolase n=1 Tax=Phenylobacterium terrae TaxID=2665495 RepID=A0ABW4MX22_9CAUL